MSNHKFIQVYPPKEELPLPVHSNIFDFNFIFIPKTDTESIVQIVSPLATFAGIVAGDYIEASITDPITLLETKLGTLEIAVITSTSVVESVLLDMTLDSNKKIAAALQNFKVNTIIPKLYKLPTNNFSLQVKTDSIVRYYEDPVDKTIMYLDTLESPSICGNGGPGVCVDIWGHDRASLGIVTLNNTDKIPMHNIVPYLNSIFLGATDEN